VESVISALSLDELEGIVDRAELEARGTPCMRALGPDGNGRYPQLISREFMTDMVMVGPPKKNLVCHCASPILMICRIYVIPDSLEESSVDSRLDRSNAERLSPFFVVNDPEGSSSDAAPPIFFEDRTCDPRVLCEVRVESMTRYEGGIKVNKISQDIDPTPMQKSQSDPGLRSPSPPKVSRSSSSPGSLNYPSRTLPLRMCAPDVCPITQNAIVPHDIVYVLKIDEENLHIGKPVPCISAYALKKLSQQSEDRTFVDPLRRLEGVMLTISMGYESYMIVENGNDASLPTLAPTSRSESNAGPSTAGLSPVTVKPPLSRVQDLVEQFESLSPHEEHVATENTSKSRIGLVLFPCTFIIILLICYRNLSSFAFLSPHGSYEALL